MRKFLIFFVLNYFAVSALGQAVSNSLSGSYVNGDPKAMYSSIAFDGKGHAVINDSFQAEYFQKDDVLYILPDKSVFIFKVEKNQLKGHSSWVEENTFKPSDPTIVLEESVSFPSYPVNPQLLYEFYQLNFIEGTDQIRLDMIENEQEYQKQMESLCKQNLTVACGAYFSMLYLEHSGGFSSLFSSKKENTFQENPEMENIAKKMISLGDYRGYSLLGSYYYALENHEKALDIYNEGIEKGDMKSMIILMELELMNTTDDLFIDEEVTK